MATAERLSDVGPCVGPYCRQGKSERAPRGAKQDNQPIDWLYGAMCMQMEQASSMLIEVGKAGNSSIMVRRPGTLQASQYTFQQGVELGRGALLFDTNDVPYQQLLSYHN